MKNISNPSWKDKRTEESGRVETVLKSAGFARVDAYRYNSASIRVRVIDDRFEGLANESRDDLIEPWLKRLPERIQADIVNLLTFAPSELDAPGGSTRALLLNSEFEDPSPSRL